MACNVAETLCQTELGDRAEVQSMATEHGYRAELQSGAIEYIERERAELQSTA